MDRNQDRKAEKSYGIFVSVFTIAFGMFWCIMAASIGGWIMVPFGLIFVGLAIYRLAVLLKLTKEEKKPREPWEAPRRPREETSWENAVSANFCPYCGKKTEEKFTYCPNCGRRIG